MTAPIPVTITTAGLAKLLAASNSGLAATISHIALGRGFNAPVPGYQPNVAAVSLADEFWRIPVAGGQRIDATTILVEGFGIPIAPAIGWAHEMGVFLSDGTLLGVHSSPSGPITYVGAGEAMVLAITLGVAALPANVLDWTAGAPTFNLILGEPIADIAAAILGLQATVLSLLTDVAALKQQVN